MKYLVLGVALITGSAHAYTGNELLSDIDGELIANIGATQYVRGVVEGVQAATVWSDRPDICLPENVTVGQVRDVVRQELQRSPATRHQQAKYIVYASVAKAWPCKVKGAK